MSVCIFCFMYFYMSRFTMDPFVNLFKIETSLWNLDPIVDIKHVTWTLSNSLIHKKNNNLGLKRKITTILFSTFHYWWKKPKLVRLMVTFPSNLGCRGSRWVRGYHCASHCTRVFVVIKYGYEFGWVWIKSWVR